MDLLFWLFVIGAIAFGVTQASKQRGAANTAWADVARAHGLRFSPASLTARPSLRGEVDGFLVVVDTVTRGSGKSSQTFTRFRVHYDKLGPVLRLTREVPVVSALGKMFGGQDHEVGDPDFDDKVIVRSPSEAQVREYLTPARRRAIERFLSAHRNAVITESAATFETAGMETRAAGLERGVRLVVELATELVPGAAATPAKQLTGQERRAARRDAAAADVAAALGVVAGMAGKDDDDWTLPPAPASSRASSAAPALRDAAPLQPAPPLRPASALRPASPLTAAAPLSSSTTPASPPAPPPGPPPEAEPAPERIAIGSAPAMPSVAPIDPDAGARDAPPGEKPPASGRAQDVCDALFAEDGGLSHATTRFEEEYESLFVHWTGELRSARHYYSDLVFGSEAGTRAELMVAKVASGILGEREIIAVVQLPDGADTDLAPRVGETVTVEGDLAKVDPYMRQIFIRNARVTS